jgi:serine/threonine-protein kinase HipA
MKKLNKNEETLLELISKRNEITISEILQEVSIARRTAQRALKSLSELNLIEILGTTRDRIYRRIFNKGEAPFKFLVFQSAIKVGELHFGNGEYVFTYDDQYNGEELEGLTKAVPNYSHELFAYFENLIPEYKRRERLLQGKSDIAEVLESLNNSHGALDFIQKHKLFEYKPNYGKRENWISVKNKILLENDFPNLIEADVQISDDIINADSNTEHSDLSGYQTKVDVNIDFEKMVISESKQAEYLLKPRNKNKSNYFNQDEDGTQRYYPYIAINEHLFMSFAKNELGFNVPYSGIIKAKDMDFHYITKRYDRINGLKYNQVDFAQVLNVQSDDKYKLSSEELFKAINIKLSSSDARLEALMFYYYSYLIKHADLHLKNIGALEIGMKKYILTPLYDVISVGAYNGDSWDLGLSMNNPPKKPKNWNLQDFYKLAKIVGISERLFKKEARAMTEIFIVKMPEYIDKLKEFEKTHPLNMQQSRVGSYKSFSQRIDNMYKEKIIQLKKLGFIQELNLIDIAGGLLSREL